MVLLLQLLAEHSCVDPAHPPPEHQPLPDQKHCPSIQRAAENRGGYTEKNAALNEDGVACAGLCPWNVLDGFHILSEQNTGAKSAVHTCIQHETSPSNVQISSAKQSDSRQALNRNKNSAVEVHLQRISRGNMSVRGKCHHECQLQLTAFSVVQAAKDA